MEKNKGDQEFDYVIYEITVNGLWRRVSRHLRLDKEVNFIVGRNGAGKTSIIRLVAGVIRGDYSPVKDLWFSRLIIRLKSVKDKSTIIIRVAREGDNKYGF